MRGSSGSKCCPPRLQLESRHSRPRSKSQEGLRRWQWFPAVGNRILIQPVNMNTLLRFAGEILPALDEFSGDLRNSDCSRPALYAARRSEGRTWPDLSMRYLRVRRSFDAGRSSLLLFREALLLSSSSWTDAIIPLTPSSQLSRLIGIAPIQRPPRVCEHILS